jgi:thioredoxin 2
MADLELDQRGVVVACSHCGKKNRLAFERLAEAVRCGECKQPLPPVSTPLEAGSTADFDRLVSQASIPIVVDFWAPWCGPCRMVAPELVKVAARANGRFLIVKVNTDVLADLGERFGIRSIPTLAVFIGGRVAARTAGARPAADIEAFVIQAASAAPAEKSAH